MTRLTSERAGDRVRTVSLVIVLLGGLAYAFVSAAGTILFIREGAGEGQGTTWPAVIHLGMAGYLCYAVARRLAAGAPPWSSWRYALAAALRGGARGWWIGLAALSLIELARSALSLPSWRLEATAIADAIGFAVTTLVMSIPALAALALARYLDRSRSTPI